jgi:hypothetical protein
MSVEKYRKYGRIYYQPHGTPACYKMGCRCDKCDKIFRTETGRRKKAPNGTHPRRKYFQERYYGKGLIPSKVSTHGTMKYYKNGCRCTKCMLTYREYINNFVRQHRQKQGDQHVANRY